MIFPWESNNYLVKNNKCKKGGQRKWIALLYLKHILMFNLNFRSSVELRKKEHVRKNDLIDIMLDALKDYQVCKYMANKIMYIE